MAKVTVWYKGTSEVVMNVRGYDVSIADPVFEVDEEDWKHWPDKKFFERVEGPDPERVEAEGPPLDRAVTIDPSDGISVEEAVMAERALARYREERVDARLRRVQDVDSHDWQDYYEAARDEDD